MQAIANYIDGRFTAPLAGRYVENVNPATGEVYSCVPDSDAADVQAAVEAARRAFPEWSRTTAEQRSRLLLRVADLIEQNLERLALAECIDNGKPLSRCRAVDIPRAVQNFRFFATAILHTRSELHDSDGEALNYTLRRPRGVCGLISPWNLPLYLLTWKVAPALATGNTAVAKPSEVTPMTAHLLALLCQEAGLPRGVLNIVHGLGAKAGVAIVSHPDVTTVSFTGSTRAGAAIASAAAPMFKKLSLEMGGKNPNIIFADADLEAALTQSVAAAFANQGQICLCGSRLLVQQSVFDEFVPAFVERARRLRIGDPLDAATEQGAVVSEAHLRKIESCVETARGEGGEILCGGRRPVTLPERCRGGYFYEPTVIVGLGMRCRTNQEEIFGPVVSVLPFDDEPQVVELANATRYGLSASIWTRDVDRAHRVSAALDAGTVWVNCWLLRDLRVPFGGVKQSGVGREGGEEALRFFTEPKNVCVRTPGL
ncbi:MAG: aldehyde dehydrogenase [Phycisphaerae bacterium]